MFRRATLLLRYYRTLSTQQMEMLFADCINDHANYILMFMIKLILHVNNSSQCIDTCAHGNSAYLVVIKPQSLQQQSITYINTNRWYCSITDLYIYTSCSAVALIVVELRPGSHYCHAWSFAFLVLKYLPLLRGNRQIS